MSSNKDEDSDADDTTVKQDPPIAVAKSKYRAVDKVWVGIITIVKLKDIEYGGEKTLFVQLYGTLLPLT